MSEYQYYEFLAIDRPMTSTQIDEVRRFSTRAEIGPTSFTNEYHWGDFKGDPIHFLTRYFDAMVYTANWGTREFMFRVPRALVDVKAIEGYVTEQSVNVSPKGEWLIIDLSLQPDDGGDYDDSEGAGWMASLVGIRAEILAGDFRSLYLAWLVELQNESISADDEQPPVPRGLANLTAAQTALVNFLGIDKNLIGVAAAKSPPSAIETVDLAAAMSRVPETEKDRWLLELIETDAPHAALRLRSKLMAFMPMAAHVPAPIPAESPTELLERWKQQVRDREEQQRIAAEAKRKKKAAEAAAEREQHLNRLAKHLPGAWQNVEQLIGLKTQEGYKQAVALLKDLKAVHDRLGGDPAGFRKLLLICTETHARKGNFIAMVKTAGLI